MIESPRGEPTDDELLEMAFGEGPEFLPHGWDALLDASPELRRRFERAAARVRSIRRSRAALDRAPYAVEALLALRAVVRNPPSLSFDVLLAAEPLLGPDGPAGDDGLDVVPGTSDRERIVQMEVGERVFLRFEAPADGGLEVVGTDRAGRRSPLRWRREGGKVATEAWRLERDEAPVVIGCSLSRNGAVESTLWAVLTERDEVGV